MSMPVIIALAVVAVALFVVVKVATGAKVKGPEVKRRLESGTSLLVDVREEDEWRDGVVQGARRAPLSDLQGDRRRWKPLLAEARDKELLLYCRSGARSSFAARILSREGVRAVNVGSLRSLQSAGLPVSRP
jgi:rhodanese-related sulfurtransferase